MARLANIVPRSHKCFDPLRNLTRSNVAINQHGLIVTFKCTKTIQFGERKLHIPLLRLSSSPLCPVSVYQRMVCLFPASSRCALFVLPSPYSPTILTQDRFIAPSVGPFLPQVFLTLCPIEVILSFAVRPLGPLITVCQVNSYRYTETGLVMHIRLI